MHVATALLVGLGLTTSGRGPADNEIYDPSAGIFSVTGSDAGNMMAVTANLLTNSKVLLTSEFYGDPSDGA